MNEMKEIKKIEAGNTKIPDVTLLERKLRNEPAICEICHHIICKGERTMVISLGYAVSEPLKKTLKGVKFQSVAEKRKKLVCASCFDTIQMAWEKGSQLLIE